MMEHRSIWLCIMSLVISCTAWSSPKIETHWEVLKQSDGITVSRHQQLGKSILSFKGRGKVEGSLVRLVNIMTDVSKMPAWIDGCIKAQIVRKNFTAKSFDMNADEFQMTIWGENFLPWPLNNRDYVLSGSIDWSVEGSDLIATISLVKDKAVRMPPADGVIPMKDMNSQLILRESSQHKDEIDVEMIVTVDPGGVLPAWASNIVASSFPHKTIMSLRRLMQQNAYDQQMENLIQYHYDKAKAASLSH